MPRLSRRRFPNIEAVKDQRTGVLRGWRATVWLDGRAKRGSTREDQETAYEDARGFLDLRDRLDDDGPSPTIKTVAGRVESMLEVKNRRPATKAWYLEKFEQIKAEFGEDTLLRDVTRQKVQTWINRRLRTDKVSPNTVHHVLRALRRMFSVANLPSPTRDSRLIVPDQVPAQLDIPAWQSIERKLAKIEKENDVAWGMLGLFAYSGIRRTEAARLRIDDLDLDEGLLRIQHAKVANQPRMLPMPEGLKTFAALAMAWRGQFGGRFDKSLWVFPGETETQRVEFLVRLSRKWDVRLHSLRHAFASELARRGVPVHVIARLLGHRLGGMTMRYVHEALPELRQAMEKLWEKAK